MALSPREAFKVGFLLRCADEGLAPEQVQERLQKAAGVVGSALNWGGQQVGKGVAGGLGLGWETALGAPLLAGGLGGYALHKLTEDNIDEEDLRKQEMIDELRQWSRRAREQQKHKLLRLQPGL